MTYHTRRRLLLAALVVVSVLTVNFAVRALNHGRRFRARVDEPIQAWMNVPYISRAYRVPPQVVAAAMGLPPGQRDRRPLREIAQEQGSSPDAMIAAIMAAIAQERSAPRPPNPGRPEPPPPAAPAPPPGNAP